MARKSLSGLNQKYRGKPKKYADGGRVRSPATAPVASPFDPDYIARLAAQAVGAGEPVTEVRSSEGRGFAPMPRDPSENLQRLRAVIRGEVEPTPSEQSAINILRGFTEGPAIISPATARAIPMATRLPTDERFVRAVEATPGARISDEGLSLELLRYQKPEQAGAQAIREGVFYLPATLPSRSVGTYKAERFNPRPPSYGGSERVRGETLLRAPLAVPGKTGGNVPFNAYRELGGDEVALRVPREIDRTFSWSPSYKKIPSPASYRAVEDWLAARGGNPEMATDIVNNSLIGDQLFWAMRENVIGNKARQAGYDSIVGTGARKPRISEVFDLREGAYPVPGRPEFETLVPYFEDYVPRYAEGGLAALEQKYAEGGTVRAPKETTISGQDHRLAYITPEEAALLKARGGSGRMTDYGIRAYDGDGDGGAGGGEGGGGEGQGGDASDNSTSNSEASSQDAAGGNAGQGAGPSGAGASASGQGGEGGEGEGQEGGETDTEASVAQTTAPAVNTAPFGQTPNALGLGMIGTMAGLGLGVPGLGTLGTAIGTAMDVGNMNAQLGMMGLSPSVEMGPALASNLSFGMLGESPAAQFGQALGFDALAEAPMSAFSDQQAQAPGPDTNASGGTSAEPVVGVDAINPQLAALNQSYSEQLSPTYRAWDWNQIQRDAAANNMTVDQYVASRGLGYLGSNAPVLMKEGGAVSLEQMHAKYAEGGEVYPPAGEVAEYDPDEIDRIARQIHLRFPAEEDAVYVPADDVASPSDLTMRARMLMRGQTMGLPETVGTSDGNDRFTASTSLRDMPIEGDQYGTSQRALNTGINAILDAERNARIGAGVLALERSGERGFTGYGPQLSAGYGPASIYGGYQTITPNMPGAKSQGSYVYGGNLNIPIDESGTEANIGGSVMSGRRSPGAGMSGTQIMGSLERPLLGGRLALELAADPSLRHKEILLGYRRAF